MQGVVGAVVDPDKEYWNMSMEIMAKDCYGLPVDARDHLKAEVHACISRFKQGVNAGVRLPCADLQYHTQKRFVAAQAPPPLPAPAPAPPAHPQGPLTLTSQQVAQLQASIQGHPIVSRPQGYSSPISFGPRPQGSSTPVSALDFSIGEGFWSLLQPPMPQPNTPAPAETASSSTTAQNTQQDQPDV